MLSFVVKPKDNSEKNNYYFRRGLLLLTILIAKLVFVHGLGVGLGWFWVFYFGSECVVYTFREA